MSASGMTPLHSKASNHSLRDLQVSEDGRLVAIAKLRPRIREAVEIHQLQECSLNETADSLGISVAAVKGRLFHARAALRRVPRLKFALRRTSSVRRMSICIVAGRLSAPCTTALERRRSCEPEDIRAQGNPKAKSSF
jgi:hypothetical protein